MVCSFVVSWACSYGFCIFGGCWGVVFGSLCYVVLDVGVVLRRFLCYMRVFCFF